MLLKPETEAAIRNRAYQIWEDEGRPNGRHEIHWQRAYDAILEIATLAPVGVTDLSLIDGIGPKIKKQLEAEGVTSLSQLAALMPGTLDALDAKLGLKGRSARESWIVQAKELLAGQAPRAKTDKARLTAKSA